MNISLKYQAIFASSAIVVGTLLLLFFHAILGSYFLAWLCLMVAVSTIAYKLGTLLMYPYAFKFLFCEDVRTRSDDQISRANSILTCYQSLFSTTPQRLSEEIIPLLIDHPTSIIAMYSHFTNLSTRKTLLLNMYRQLHSYLSLSIQGNTLYDYIQTQNTALIQGNDIREQIISVAEDIKAVLRTYARKEGTISNLRDILFQEQLHQVRFTFGKWDGVYQYDIHMVENGAEQIESVIIYGKTEEERSTKEQCQKNKKKVILVSNPNGVYLQEYGLVNKTIKTYIQENYIVIMWNYRGYGQSTGTPSITNGMSDVYAVYSHYSKLGYNIGILHGSSIGGTATVHLAYRLRTSTLQRIIIDKSFCRLSNMAISFGKVISTLGKLIFYFQNLNFAAMFREVRCQKLVIWDIHDEIILAEASLKVGLLNSSPLQQCNELGNKLYQTLLGVKQNHQQSSQQKLEMVSPLSSPIVLNGDLNEVNGGGLCIWRDMVSATKDSCLEYVKGIIHYGVFHIDNVSYEAVQKHTIERINVAIESLHEKYQVGNAEYLMKPMNKQCCGNIVHILKQIKALFLQRYNEENILIYGHLLATANGHNGGLNCDEIDYVRRFLGGEKRRKEETHWEY